MAWTGAFPRQPTVLLRSVIVAECTKSALIILNIKVLALNGRDRDFKPRKELCLQCLPAEQISSSVIRSSTKAKDE